MILHVFGNPFPAAEDSPLAAKPNYDTGTASPRN